jgi:hypothetical protein
MTNGTAQDGIKQIYQTKPGGDEWYIGDDLTNDKRVEIKGHYKKPSQNGGFHNGAAGSGSPPTFRVVVSQKNGYNENKTQDLAEHRDQAAQKGYLQDDNDWTNYEMTGYFKVKRTGKSDQLTMYGRGGKHSDDNTRVQCQGSAYKARIAFDGKPDLAKEYYHHNGDGYQYSGSGRDFPDGPVHENIGSIMNKWIGMKTCVYNLPNKDVKIEIWVDESMSNDGKTTQNSWDKIFDITDSGSMGKKDFPVQHCGAPSPSQIISWGGPQVTYRIDEISDMDFQKLSVREISP